MTRPDPLRDPLARILSWHEAHATFDDAVADLPAALRGVAPAGLPYSPWQLLEHLRRTQHDILDFCRNSDYAELDWPAARYVMRTPLVIDGRNVLDADRLTAAGFVYDGIGRPVAGVPANAVAAEAPAAAAAD